MAKFFLAVILTACLVYMAQCQDDESSLRGGKLSAEESGEHDLKANIKQFKKFFLEKKYNKAKHHQKDFKALFLQLQCEANTCPKECPGSCGSYEGSLVCVCKQLNFVNPCTEENLSRGHNLFPYKFDASKFLACGPVPGPVYIKSCPKGLVYDERYCVCNYPWALH